MSEDYTDLIRITEEKLQRIKDLEKLELETNQRVDIPISVTTNTIVTILTPLLLKAVKELSKEKEARRRLYDIGRMI